MHSHCYTPEQLNHLSELSIKVSEWFTHIYGEERNSDLAQYSDDYLDCFEEQVNNKLLPSASLICLNYLQIQEVRNECANKISGVGYPLIEDCFTEEQVERLSKLLNTCKLKADELVRENKFDTSPDAIISELQNYFGKTPDNLSKSKKIAYQNYSQFLLMFLIDDSNGTSTLNEKQTQDLWSIFLSYAYEYRKERKLVDKNFCYKSLDELIQKSKSFYNKKLKQVNSKEDLRIEKDKACFLYFVYLLEILSDSDYLHLFMSDIQTEEIAEYKVYTQ